MAHDTSWAKWLGNYDHFSTYHPGLPGRIGTPANVTSKKLEYHWEPTCPGKRLSEFAPLKVKVNKNRDSIDNNLKESEVEGRDKRSEFQGAMPSGQSEEKHFHKQRESSGYTSPGWKYQLGNLARMLTRFSCSPPQRHAGQMGATT